jgi:hypothetical protein
MRRSLLLLWALACVPLLTTAGQPPSSAAATNVFVVTLDGMRWQEVFGGLAPELLTREAGGVRDGAEVEKRFGGATEAARRERLMPFFWSTIVSKGQIFGDPASKSSVRVTNDRRFSYPGYNELSAGFPDPRIDSNDPRPNPNVTVFEWLNRRPGFEGRVAAFASWQIMPWILNAQRSGIPCNAEGAPVAKPTTERDRLLNEFADDLPPYWDATRFDATTGFGAIEYLRTHRPRVLLVMLGETDDWAHGRRYDLYLDAARRSDRFIRRLWETAQAMPEYVGKTALIVGTDHGRGDTPKDWTDHGEKFPAAERIWMAVLGPGVPRLGSRASVDVTQAQFAATIAALVGEDYVKAQPKAAAPLPLRP